MKNDVFKFMNWFLIYIQYHISQPFTRSTQNDHKISISSNIFFNWFLNFYTEFLYQSLTLGNKYLRRWEQELLITIALVLISVMRTELLVSFTAALIVKSELILFVLEQ